jgi:carbonic anhydrase/acetyltransferase-like protein (isoleucine patch superfamily)
MPLYKLGEIAPRIAASAYVAPNATVLGNVVLAERASVWFAATCAATTSRSASASRATCRTARCCTPIPAFPLNVAANVTIGHQAMLHGCTVGEGSLIGIQSVVLNGAVIGKGCLVGAGAIVTEHKVFGDGWLILGAPAKAVRELTAAERENLLASAANYAARAQRYRDHLRSSASRPNLVSHVQEKRVTDPAMRG